jgi:hypothetical protein
MNKLMESLKTTTKFHEIKLFFIHEHFDVMSVEQLNQLVDIFILMYKRTEYKFHPFLSQFNTVKYALLVYRVSWRIQQKNIYSLITKCQLINQYIEKSLNGYLERQTNIG